MRFKTLPTVNRFFCMFKNQVVTITFFRFTGWKKRWWAFRQMGLAPDLLRGIPGLQFAKMLGSGAGNGFSVLPNLGAYGLLCAWDDEAAAKQFFASHELYADYQKNSTEQWTLFMRATMAHGQWDGVEPFQISEQFDENQLVGVITRATIHTKHLLGFWRFVPAVSRSVADKKGLLFSVGIGELPIIQQATFSLWENSKRMQAYAYQSQYHKEVVKRTRELGWYKEELFARFHPYASFGTWQGEEPLADFHLQSLEI